MLLTLIFVISFLLFIKSNVNYNYLKFFIGYVNYCCCFHVFNYCLRPDNVQFHCLFDLSKS